MLIESGRLKVFEYVVRSKTLSAFIDKDRDDIIRQAAYVIERYSIDLKKPYI